MRVHNFNLQGWCRFCGLSAAAANGTFCAVEICAEDFDRIVAERDNPPNPTPAAREANRRYHEILAAMNAKGAA